MVVQECILISMFPRTPYAQSARLNGCGLSNERQYCCLSADVIFVSFNEPFFRIMSLTEVISFGGCVDMVV